MRPSQWLQVRPGLKSSLVQQTGLKHALPAVATGFPAGQTPLETRVEEVVRAVADGATEIDIVINRNLALTGQWEGILFHLRSSILTADGNLVGLFYKSASSLCPALYDELRQFRLACADAHMKTILAVGDLDNFTTVYKASLVAMMAGRSHDSLFSRWFRNFDSLALNRNKCTEAVLSSSLPPLNP